MSWLFRGKKKEVPEEKEVEREEEIEDAEEEEIPKEVIEEKKEESAIERFIIDSDALLNEVSIEKLEDYIKIAEIVTHKAEDRLLILKEEEKAKKEESLKKLEKYREECYVATRLENVMNEDFEKDVYTLRTLNENIKKIGKGFEKEIENISGKLKDVDAINEIEGTLSSIEGRDKVRRRVLEEKVEDWRKKGYVVTRLKNLLKEPIPTIEKELEIYESNVLELKKLEKRLKSFEKLYESDVVNVRKLLNNPDNILEIEKKLMNWMKELELGKKNSGKKSKNIRNLVMLQKG